LGLFQVATFVYERKKLEALTFEHKYYFLNYNCLLETSVPKFFSPLYHFFNTPEFTTATKQRKTTMDDFDMGLLDDKTYMVSVLRQKMLGIAPVFTYRIKEGKSPGQEYK
jgi:hypothetical protein